MSTIFIDSFDGYTTDINNYWLPSGVSSPLVTTTGARTDQCMVVNNAGAFRSLGGTFGEVIFGFAFLSQGVTEVMEVWLVNTTTAGTTTFSQCKLQLGPDCILRIIPFNGSAMGVSSATGPYAGFGYYNYIEWQCGIGAAALNKIWLNNALIYSGTLNTNNSGTLTGANYMNFTGPGGGAVNLIDDLYVASSNGAGVTTNAGDLSVINFMPSGTGSFSQWTPVGSSTNWQNVREIPEDGDITYNIAPSAGLIDTYAIGTVNATDSIPTTQLVQLVRNDSIAGETADPFLVISGGTQDISADNYTPGSIYLPPFLFPFDTQGTSATTWTGSVFNTTQWGIKRAS